jgi:hypothetical protein
LILGIKQSYTKKNRYYIISASKQVLLQTPSFSVVSPHTGHSFSESLSVNGFPMSK